MPLAHQVVGHGLTPQEVQANLVLAEAYMKAAMILSPVNPDRAKRAQKMARRWRGAALRGQEHQQDQRPTPPSPTGLDGAPRLHLVP